MSETIDICERAAEALRASGMDCVHAQRLDRITGRDGVVVRMMPPRTVATYFDGTRRIDCTLQVIAKSLDPTEAMAECDRASEILRSADLSSANGSYELADPAYPAEPDGDVEELAVGTDRRHVWAIRLVIQIIRQ